MARPSALTDLSLPELARRRSAKWSEYPADVLPAWVAEMDFRSRRRRACWWRR